jgi:exopolysaccharide biosynthesis polyprenyl glycosylphosphotransferase
VALPCPGLDDTELRRLGWELEGTGTGLYVSTGMRDVADHRARSTDVAGMRMLHVRPATRRGVRRAVKAGAERVAAATALTLLLPLLLTIAAAVRLTSSGPAIFKQTRVGRNGHRFTMYKFRTMSTDAERVKATLSEQNECNEVLFKMRQDPRITKVGAVLRRYSLDEVPQLANVVLGHMSLVGPRPALPAEVAKYERDPMRRLAVKPGLTGLWQVSGRSDLSWDDSVRLDLRYVDNWSLGMDATIVLRTVQAVLGHRGAY